MLIHKQQTKMAVYDDSKTRSKCPMTHFLNTKVGEQRKNKAKHKQIIKIRLQEHQMTGLFEPE